MALSDKQKLMRKIQDEAFALVDVMLYLDSHPDCKEALSYFKKHRAMKEKLVEDFEKTYGPITAEGVLSDDRWTWSTCAFPWERGES